MYNGLKAWVKRKIFALEWIKARGKDNQVRKKGTRRKDLETRAKEPEGVRSGGWMNKSQIYLFYWKVKKGLKLGSGSSSSSSATGVQEKPEANVLFLPVKRAGAKGTN